MLCAELAVVSLHLAVPESDWLEHFLRYQSRKPPRDAVGAYWARVRLATWIRIGGSLLVAGVFSRIAFVRVTKRSHWDNPGVGTRAWTLLLCTWATIILRAAQFTVFLYLPCASCSRRTGVCWYSLADFCVHMLSDVTVYLYFRLQIDRFQLVEVGFRTGFGSKLLIALVRVNFCLWVLALGLIAMSPLDGGLRHVTWVVVQGVQAMIAFLMSGVVFWALAKVRRPTLQTSPKGLSPYMEAERAWARDILASTRLLTVLPLWTNGVAFLAKAVAHEYEVLRGLYGYACIVDSVAFPLSMCIGVLCIFLLVGELDQERPKFRDDREALAPPIVAPKSRSASCAWNARVSALASRGMSASSLLDFFEELGTRGRAMPHFDPRRSTTNDVVRQAVVPLSRCGDLGFAYAELFTPEGQEMPVGMVTHVWCCRFAVSVAAVIAHAIGEGEYGDVLSALEEGRTRELRKRLGSSGGRVYWICAFCVNQHAGICSGFGSAPPEGTEAYRRWDAARRDSVTGKVFRPCACRQPKFLSDRPDECEMNKFDDMMAELSDQVPDLQHVIVIDPAFTVFTRAWCVAELAQGSASRVPQRMMLMTREGIDIHSEDMGMYRSLASLTVAECEASRQEDKELIMSRILNVERFDSHVQDLIFGDEGLGRQAFVGFGHLVAAVRISRRLSGLRSFVDEEAA